jgi:hypothetical protein
MTYYDLYELLNHNNHTECHSHTARLGLWDFAQVKIMELMASMNSRLFDALPALLTEEISANSDFDGKALAASSLGGSLMRGMWQAISSSCSALRGQYTRLGQLLGSWPADMRKTT